MHNRSPTKVLKDKTPYECWFGQKPNVSNLKVFGCTCFVHTPDSLRKKLDPKSTKGIFVIRNGYKVNDIESKTFIRSRNVLFHEDKFHEFQSNKSETVLKESDSSNDGDDDVQSTEDNDVQSTEGDDVQ